MKTPLILLVLALLVLSCEPAEPDPPFTFSIYKTTADYFENYCTDLDEDGNPTGIKNYSLDDDRIFLDGNDTIYGFRIKLDSGYAMGGEISLESRFTTLLINDVVRMNGNNQPLKADTIKAALIPEDPFVAFYNIPFSSMSQMRDSVSFQFAGIKDLYYALLDGADEINEIIANQELEEHFTKLK